MAKRITAALLALTLGANAAAMLFAGPWWFGAVPGVEDRAVQPAFRQGHRRGLSGGGRGPGRCAWRAARPLPPQGARRAARFLALHAVDPRRRRLVQRGPAADLVRDFPASSCRRCSPSGRRRRLNPAGARCLEPCFTAIHRPGADLELRRRYMREVLAASPWAFLKFAVVGLAGSRAATPRPRPWRPPAWSGRWPKTAAPAPRSASTWRSSAAACRPRPCAPSWPATRRPWARTAALVCRFAGAVHRARYGRRRSPARGGRAAMGPGRAGRIGDGGHHGAHVPDAEIRPWPRQEPVQGSTVAGEPADFRRPPLPGAA